MRLDLIKIIEAHDEVTNAIVLTHNMDFVFLQMIVPGLATLRTANPHGFC